MSQVTSLPTSPSGIAPTAANRWMLAYQTAHVLFWVGAVLAILGISLGSPPLIAAGTAALSAGFVSLDAADARRGHVTAITVYAMISCITGVANTVGLLAADGPRRAVYFLYTAEEHLTLAMLLALASAVLPVRGFWAVTRWGIGSGIRAIPPIVGRISDRRLVPTAVVLVVLYVAGRYLVPIGDAGTITGVFFSIPYFVSFVLARAAAERNVPGAAGLGLTVALLEAMRAYLFEYLRANTVLPLLAFGLGYLLGARSLRVLKRPVFYPIYAAGLAFVITFGLIGQIRAAASGTDRLISLRDRSDDVAMSGDFVAPRQTVLSRATSFNQLSQIGRVVEEDGFYNGETLEYLAFVFIPRFLWPEKPYVAKGSWFAVRIGQAILTPNGWYNNAINMTQVGELYLNFGWLGVFIGGTLFGAMLAIYWTRTLFWRDPRNVLGSSFALYLLIVAIGIAGDLTIVVTLLAVYLIFLFLSVIMRGIEGRMERRRGGPHPVLGSPERAGPLYGD